MPHLITRPACALAALLTIAASAHAQVTPVPYPVSYLNVTTGWTGALPNNTAYGAFFPNAGSGGYISAVYDSTPGPTLGSLAASYVNLTELRASASGFGPGAVSNNGWMEFTPIVNCTYTIVGAIPFYFSGTFNAAGANGQMGLEEIGGPFLAAYNVTLFGAPNTAGTLFNSAAPLTGSQTGSLTAGTAYRWRWNFSTSLTPGADPLANANIAAVDGPAPYFGIEFTVPTPAAASLLALASFTATRRRR